MKKTSEQGKINIKALFDNLIEESQIVTFDRKKQGDKISSFNNPDDFIQHCDDKWHGLDTVIVGVTDIHSRELKGPVSKAGNKTITNNGNQQINAGDFLICGPIPSGTVSVYPIVRHTCWCSHLDDLVDYFRAPDGSHRIYWWTRLPEVVYYTYTSQVVPWNTVYNEQNE